MAGELIIAATAAGAMLAPGVLALYRASHARPRTTVDHGECLDEDCRECAALFGTPPQAASRQTPAGSIKPPTRKGW